MPSELCALITGPTFEKAYQQLERALRYAELVELRLDLFPIRPLDDIKCFLNASPFPVLVTLRKKEQGGDYAGTEEERREEIKQILRLSPSYFDLEEETNIPFFVEQFPEVSFVISHHSFAPPHPPIEAIYNNLEGGTYRKVAIVADSSTDALRMLNFARDKKDLIAIGMGEHGIITRILASLANIPWCYAPMDLHTAPGQIALETLVNVYRFPKLSMATAPYGLIGDPVTKSIGEYLHNALFGEMAWDATYVKMVVKPEQLPEFLAEAHKFGFKGLSVTTPLKEAIIPYLEEITPYAAAVQGVNTLIAGSKGYIGTNTDGPGALNALEKHTSVQGKTIVILGAGPAARAIAHEAHLRGARAITTKREQQKELPPHDILINATPASMPIQEEQILPNIVVMETNVKPLLSPFLQAAHAKGGIIIYGEEMFVEQAALQIECWGLAKPDEVREILIRNIP